MCHVPRPNYTVPRMHGWWPCRYGFSLVSYNSVNLVRTTLFGWVSGEKLIKQETWGARRYVRYQSPNVAQTTWLSFLYKIPIQYFEVLEKIKKNFWCRQWCTILLCKIWGWNTLYSRLQKNNKFWRFQNQYYSLIQIDGSVNFANSKILSLLYFFYSRCSVQHYLSQEFLFIFSETMKCHSL
jgi:hypothetical protein